MVQSDVLLPSSVKNKRNLSLFRSYRSRRSSKPEETNPGTTKDDGTDVTEEDRSHGRASPLVKEMPMRDTPTSTTRQATGFATPGKASDQTMKSPSSLPNARLSAYKMRQQSSLQTPLRAAPRYAAPTVPSSTTARSPSPAFQARQNVFANQNNHAEVPQSHSSSVVRDPSPSAFQTRRSASRARALEQTTSSSQKKAAWPPTTNSRHIVPEVTAEKEVSEMPAPSSGGWANFGDNEAQVSVESDQPAPAQSDQGWASFTAEPEKPPEEVKRSTHSSREAGSPSGKNAVNDVQETRPSLKKPSWPPQRTPGKAVPETLNKSEDPKTRSESTVYEKQEREKASTNFMKGPSSTASLQMDRNVRNLDEETQSRPEDDSLVQKESNSARVESPARSSPKTATTPPSAKSNASFSPLSVSSPQQAARNKHSSKSSPTTPEIDESKHVEPITNYDKKPERVLSPPSMVEMQKKHPVEISTPVDRLQSTIGKQLSPSTDVTVASSSATLVSFNPNSGRNNSKDPMTDVIRKDLWSSDQETVWVALLMVAAEAAASDTNRSLIARSGGLFAVVRAMETHSSVAKIQIAGCQALEKLAIDSDNELAIEQVGRLCLGDCISFLTVYSFPTHDSILFLNVGGFEAVLAAMMGHFADVLVNEAAWSTLMNLTCANSEKELTLDTSGGMRAIIEAMKAHIESPIVQKNACGALANLCGHHSKRMQAFTEANGFILLATVMQKYWNQPDVRAEACHAMSTLCDPFLTSNKPFSVVSTSVGTPVTRNGAICVHGGPQMPSSSRASSTRRYDTDLHSVASGMSYWEEETVYTVHE